MNEPLLLVRASQGQIAARLADAVASWDECVSLVGKPGVGMGSVLDQAERELFDRSIRCVRVAAPSSGDGMGLRAFMMQVVDQADPTALTDADLKAGFVNLTEPGEGYDRVALIVTEAQALLPPALRYIQLACQSSPKLLVVLAGQPSLAAALADDEFAYLRRRITRKLALPSPAADQSSDRAAAPSLPAPAARTRNLPSILFKLGLAASVALLIWTTRWSNQQTPNTVATQTAATQNKTAVQPEAAGQARTSPVPGAGVPGDSAAARVEPGTAAPAGDAGALVIWTARGGAFPVPTVAPPTPGPPTPPPSALSAPMPAAAVPGVPPIIAQPRLAPPVLGTGSAAPEPAPVGPPPAEATLPETTPGAAANQLAADAVEQRSLDTPPELDRHPEQAGAVTPSLPDRAVASDRSSEAASSQQHDPAPSASLDARVPGTMDRPAEPPADTAKILAEPPVAAAQGQPDAAPPATEQATRAPDPIAAPAPTAALPPSEPVVGQAPGPVVNANPPSTQAEADTQAVARAPDQPAVPAPEAALPPSLAPGPEQDATLPVPPPAQPPPARKTATAALPRPETAPVARAARNAAERPATPASVPSVQPTDERRCREIVLRVQLGEVPSNADQQFLRGGCRSK